MHPCASSFQLCSASHQGHIQPQQLLTNWSFLSEGQQNSVNKPKALGCFAERDLFSVPECGVVALKVTAACSTGPEETELPGGS